jgi:flagellar protein FliO/FliZ
MRITLLIIAAIYTLYHPCISTAETIRPLYTPPPPAAVSSGSLMQIIFSLILVLAAVAVVAWMMKRINMPQRGAASLLKVLSGVAVGPRERVVLMEVNDTWLIVGVAPGQVRTLHTMPKGILPSGMNNPATAPDGKFQMWLKQMVEKRNEGK